jgi:TRAP-type C4-dicarboxylate transport system permease small subunit
MSDLSRRDSVTLINDRINQVIGGCGVAVIIALTLMTVADIIMRRFFSMPFSFSFEVTQLMLVLIVFCSIPYSTSRLRHVSIEVLVLTFPKKLRRRIDIVGDFFCAAVLAAICWQSIEKGFGTYNIGTMTGELEIPLYPFYFFVSFGAMVACISLIVKTILTLKEQSQ